MKSGKAAWACRAQVSALFHLMIAELPAWVASAVPANDSIAVTNEKTNHFMPCLIASVGPERRLPVARLYTILQGRCGARQTWAP